jgi:hypothetical protein
VLIGLLQELDLVVLEGQGVALISRDHLPELSSAVIIHKEEGREALIDELGFEVVSVQLFAD